MQHLAAEPVSAQLFSNAETEEVSSARAEVLDLFVDQSSKDGTYETRKSSQELHPRRAGSIEESREQGRRQEVRAP